MVVFCSQAQKEISSNSVQTESPRDGFSEPEEEPEETESCGQSNVWQMEYNFDGDM